MKRVLAVAAMSVVLSTAGMGLAQAKAPKAGEDGSKGNAGLCNAYAHNSDQAKAHGQAFIRLAATADAADQTVEEYCAQLG